MNCAQHFSSDVLVIGGSTAGCFAAITESEGLGVRPFMLDRIMGK